MNDCLTSPIFFIGMPRSGTTIVFEAFARHDHLGWMTNYSQQFPALPWLNVIKRFHHNPLVKIHAMRPQYNRVGMLNRFMVRPGEAADFWDLYSRIDFARRSLVGERATPGAIERLRTKVRHTLVSQGGRRLATKMTGPGRIGYLKSIFPDAKFIHVVRDGRAVTHSLMRVGFWKEKGGHDAPFWQNVLSEKQVAFWENHGKDPSVLTALQWTAVVQSMTDEAIEVGASLHTVKYEDFVTSPHECCDKINAFCALARSSDVDTYLDQNVNLVNMNDKYLAEWEPEKVALLTEVMSDSLRLYGYPTA